jgi:hypothetical protein
LDFDREIPDETRPPDPSQEEAELALVDLFRKNAERVFFSRQIEVHFEDRWFHWITNRSLRDLVSRGLLKSEKRALKTGGAVTLLWHSSHRYYKRDALRVIALVEEYADPNIGAALGLHGEAMVLEGIAKREFVLKGRNTNEYGGRKWTATDHDFDFVFERDGVPYGAEVKNTLSYMDHDELEMKIKICAFLKVRPLFVVRMLPKPWIKEVVDAGGFALIMKYQLYPWSHKDLAKRVNATFGLPVDAPRALYEGTVERFVRWHESV